MDEATFKEGEHPRDKDGKFATSGSGGSSGGEGSSKELRVAAPLKSLFVAHGFKKLKQSTADQITYVHPSGLHVVVHRNPKAGRSELFSTHKKGEQPQAQHQAKGALALADLISQHLGEGAKAKAAPEPQKAAGELDKKTDAELMASFYPESNKKDLEEAEAAYAEQQQQEAKEAGGWEPEPEGLPDIKPKEVLNEKFGKYGYTPADIQPTMIDDDLIIYNKPSGSRILLNKKTGEWIAETPGFTGKTGKTLEGLEQLLGSSGKQDNPPWKNSPTTIATASGLKPPGPEAPAHQKLIEELNAAAPKPTSAEENAISYYTGSGYGELNNNLRHQPGFTNPKVKALDDYLDKSTIPQDVTLYRNVSGDYAKILKSILFKGGKFVDRGFISTSTSPNLGLGGSGGNAIKFKINVKAGSKGASVHHASSHKSEYEVLLPRGSVFHVKSYDRKNGVYEVEVEGKDED